MSDVLTRGKIERGFRDGTAPTWIPAYKNRARKAVKLAVASGRLKKPLICEHCCIPQSLDGHHAWGYARENWLKVQWLCQVCHRVAEKQGFLTDPPLLPLPENQRGLKSDLYSDIASKTGRINRPSRARTVRYAVYEQRVDRRVHFLGVVPAVSPEDAIAVARRYAMRGPGVYLSARKLQVTKG